MCRTFLLREHLLYWYYLHFSDRLGIRGVSVTKYQTDQLGITQARFFFIFPQICFRIWWFFKVLLHLRYTQLWTCLWTIIKYEKKSWEKWIKTLVNLRSTNCPNPKPKLPGPGTRPTTNTTDLLMQSHPSSILP